MPHASSSRTRRRKLGLISIYWNSRAGRICNRWCERHFPKPTPRSHRTDDGSRTSRTNRVLIRFTSAPSRASTMGIGRCRPAGVWFSRLGGHRQGTLFRGGAIYDGGSGSDWTFTFKQLGITAFLAFCIAISSHCDRCVTDDVTRDGDKFLVIKDPIIAAPPSALVVALNWFEELNRKSRK